MKRTAAAVTLAACAMAAATASEPMEHRIDSLTRHLESVIAHRDHYYQLKEQELGEKAAEARRAGHGRARFEALSDLLGGYMAFNTDSAHAVSLLMEQEAAACGDSTMAVRAQIGKAEVYVAVGMYKEAIDLLNPIAAHQLGDSLQSKYYQVKHTAYGRLADYSVFAVDKERYAEYERMYSDSILAKMPHEHTDYILTLAEKHNEAGNARGAIKIIEDHLKGREIPTRERALYAWTLSESYGMLGDHERQKEQLLISSISDLESAVREYISLRQLALLLYDEGDMDHAHAFMTIAVDDAGKANARQRIIELNSSYPLINNIYLDTIKSQRRNVLWANVAIMALLVVLCVLLAYTRKQMKKIADARRRVSEANASLTALNDRLTASNGQLSDANREIAEISQLKEVYIGRYMEQCLKIIEEHDRFRKNIGKMLSSGKTDDARKLVKSTAAIDDELTQFYESFDNTFLRLFPLFVEELNALLLPGEELRLKKDGMLTPELRICALIRLGISDSDKIAKFLRYSLATIYNYRSRLRNKARGDRNSLEDEIRKIGRRVQEAKN